MSSGAMYAELVRKALLAALILVAILSLDIWVHGPVAATLFARAHHRPPHPLEHAFWDAEPYAAGIADYRAGRTPYHTDDLANPLPFAYPPAFVWTGRALARALPSPWGWRLYVFVYLVSVFGLQMLFATLYLRRPRGNEWLAILCVLPLAPLLSTAFLSGNIHVVWYFAGALAALPGLTRNRWLWLYLVTLTATINQPVFAALLLLPLLAGTKQYWASVLTLIAAGLAYAAAWAINPPMYRQFQQTVAAHLAVSHDFGQSVFGICMHAFNATLIPGALQVLFSAAVIVCLIWLRSRGAANDRRWWALIALAIVLVNPRIMPYDAAVGLLPAIFFLVYNQRFGWLLTLAAVIACVIWHSPLGFTPIAFAGFATWVLALLRQPAARAEGSPAISPVTYPAG